MVPEVDLPAALDAIASTRPLIDAVTNPVTVNGVANTILHWGALPVMADTHREVAEMVATSQGCLLNTGDVSEEGEETMLAAGRAAREAGIPVALDPVGVGATPTRTAVVERLVETLDITVINGNRAEVGAIAAAVGASDPRDANGPSDSSEIRGVEAVGEDSLEEVATTALACARGTDAIVVVSGETDVVADGEAAYRVAAGHPMLGRVVGTGCMLGGTLAVFAASLEDPLAASLSGTLAYGLAGERAAAGEYGPYAGPASYEVAFRDAIAGLAAEPPEASSTDRERDGEGNDPDARIDRIANPE